MKTVYLTILAVALFSFTTLDAQGDPQTQNTITHQVSIIVEPDNNVALRANNLEKDRSRYILKIYSEQGEMVFAESVSGKGGIMKAYDLSAFPQGKYEFIVFNNLKPVYSKEVVKKPATQYNFEEQPLVVELVKN
ncbi:MAG TPA: hypothetical protein DDX98_04920 [Bacteroidales bacterium]|jgi:hypothetical protein|nr:hypothetical protein [Bacteroidales bacterium]